MAKYNCKTCGAELYFNPKTGKMECEYCGSSFDPSEYAYQPEQDSADVKPAAYVDESEPVTEPATDDSTGDLRIYKCPHCGAEVITSKETAATTCVYCNRAITLSGNLTGAFRPDYVLPFTKERKDVEEAYLKLCKKSILTPRLFTKKSTIEKIKGMYIPFWLYTFDGDAGEFENIPADALKEMDNTLMDSIEPFDFSKLVAFNPAYLAGFYTQRWNEDASKNENRAKVRAKESLSKAALAHVGTYSGGMTIENEQYRWTNQKVHYAMLPVWMMYTEYKGKKYLFGMNGQTGKIVGDIPKDPMKLVEIGGGIFLVSQIIMMILRVLGVML